MCSAQRQREASDVGRSRRVPVDNVHADRSKSRAAGPTPLAMKDERGALQAHAWIERHGQLVIGNVPNLAGFTELPSVGKLV